MMAEDNRERMRLPVEYRVFVEVVSAQPGSDGEADIAVCQTLDVSATGLKVALDRQLTTGAILQIGVEPPGAADTFYLTGEVRWCRHTRSDDVQWYAGFELLNAADSDIERWERLVSSLED